jgi:nucleotide-binding universal stress UspA family protein
MSIKTVLNVLSGQAYEHDLKNAAEFCRARGAHLTALLMALDQDFYISEYQVYSDAWIQQKRKVAEDLVRNAESARESLARTGISYEVHEALLEVAWAEQEIAERALYSDLVMIGRQATFNEELRRRILGGALFQSPTPILFNRTEKPIAESMKTVLVAWDSSDAASRAVRHALEFLKEANSVHVTLVDPLAVSGVNGEEPGADVATYLARHDVKVEVDRIASSGRAVDEVLLQHATDKGADLLVMGAYKHSRLQERLFGGVTRSMLESGELALFLAH